MKCWKCGTDLAPGAAFCNACGARQSQPQVDPVSEQKPFSGMPPTGAGGNGMILTVFAAICMAVCGGLAVRALYYALRTIFNIGWYGRVSMILTFGLNVLSAAMLALMAICCALIAFKRNPRNSDGLLVCLAGSGLGFLAVKFLMMIANIITGFRYYFSGYMIAGYIGNFVGSVVGVAVAVAGIYLIERFVLGEFPILGKSVDDLMADVRVALDSIQQTAGEVSAQAQQAAQNARAAQQARARQTQYNQQQSQYGPQQAQYNQYNQYNNQQNPYQQNSYGGQTPPPPQGYAPFRLKADRSLVAFILLSIITCGIYELYFIYALARDVNAACAGDGQSTAGLVKLILLSFITCGIYGWYWYYALGNRLAANAPRYGLNFQENGTTVLLWMLLGSLLCGFGVFIGWHILIKNANSLCGAYNHQNGI